LRFTKGQPTFVHFDHVAELGFSGPGRRAEALAVAAATAVKVGRVLPKCLRLGVAVGIVDHDFAPLSLGCLQVARYVQARQVFVTAFYGYVIAPAGEGGLAVGQPALVKIQRGCQAQTVIKPLAFSRLIVHGSSQTNTDVGGDWRGEQAKPLHRRYSSAGKGYSP
jgi:hypothetical protein